MATEIEKLREEIEGLLNRTLANAFREATKATNLAMLILSGEHDAETERQDASAAVEALQAAIIILKMPLEIEHSFDAINSKVANYAVCIM